MSLIKRKRISKKNKSAWRKTDIKDVEDYLEDQRQEERIGTFEDKKDEDLFTVDVTPQKVKLSQKQKRKLNAKKPLRSLAALENTSKVQDPIVKRNHVKFKQNGRNIEQEICNPTKPRHIQANKDRNRYFAKWEKKMNIKEVKARPIEDIWAEKDFREKVPGLKDEKGWISRDLALYNMTGLGKPVIKVHDSVRHRTTKAKNFEPPHPGMSYNPSLEDHQDLIKKVVEREEKIIKEEKHLKRVTTEMFSKVTPEERDSQRLKEMRAGLDDDDENEENGPQENKQTKSKKAEKSKLKKETSDAPYETPNPPVENKKKSKKQRRKELKQKELQKKHTEKKSLKKQIADINRIKSIKSEVLEEEEALNVLKKHRKKVEFKKKFETKRLGKLKFKEPDTDVNMPEHIPGNIRNVKTESSLLVDRFKSFQKRNILPTSVQLNKQKARKIKRFPRSSHKPTEVTYQMLREKKLKPTQA